MLQSEKEKLKIEFKATNKRLMKTENRIKEIDSQIKELQLVRGYYRPKKKSSPKGHSEILKTKADEAKDWEYKKLKY